MVIANRALEVRAGSLTSGQTVLKVTAVAGPTAGWQLVLPGSLASLTAPLAVQARLIDAFGNPTADAGVAEDIPDAPEVEVVRRTETSDTALPSAACDLTRQHEIVGHGCSVPWRAGFRRRRCR